MVLLGALAFAPALAVVYVVLGAQEAFFEHRSMFLALLGGLVLGIVVAIAETFILIDASVVFVVLAFPLVETMGKTMLVGLPRFQGEPETVLLGGALSASLAAMLMMFYVQTVAQQPLSALLVAKVLLASVGFTGAHFVSGLRVAQGPAEGSVLGGFLPGLAWLVPAHVLLGLLGLVPAEGRALVQPLAGDWIWSVPLALYGIAVFVWKTPPFVRKGLPQEERRRWRREQRGSS